MEPKAVSPIISNCEPFQLHTIYTYIKMYAQVMTYKQYFKYNI